MRLCESTLHPENATSPTRYPVNGKPIGKAVAVDVRSVAHVKVESHSTQPSPLVSPQCPKISPPFRPPATNTPQRPPRLHLALLYRIPAPERCNSAHSQLPWRGQTVPFLISFHPRETVSFPDAPPAARVSAAESVLKRAMRTAVVEEGRRPDGRGIDETRDLTGEVCMCSTLAITAAGLKRRYILPYCSGGAL